MRRVVSAAVAAGLLVSGCAGELPFGSASSGTIYTVAPSGPQTSTPPVTPTLELPGASAPGAVPGLGVWTPTCTSSDADAASLRGNLLAQPAFSGATPSSVPGFADAAATAVRPLYDCPVAHSLAVQAAVSVGSDQQATTVLRATISALLRTVVLTLSPNKIGRFGFGKVGLAQARPVFEAVLGPPTKVATGSCEMSGTWTILQWGGLSVTFDNNVASQPVDSWSLRTGVAYPKNLEITDDWPFTATIAQLRARKNSITQSALFANDSEPWVATATPGLSYFWFGSPNATSDEISGGLVRGCE